MSSLVVLAARPMVEVFFVGKVAVGRTLPTGLVMPIGFLKLVVDAPVDDLVTEPALATEDEELAFLSVETVLWFDVLGYGVSPRVFASCDGIVDFFFAITPGVLIAEGFGESDGRPGRDILLANVPFRSVILEIGPLLRITVCGVVVTVVAFEISM